MLALVWLTPFVVGTAIGLSGIVVRRLPLIAAATLLFAYLAFITWYGILTATCPHCSGGDGDRVYYLSLYAWFWGSLLGSLLLGIAAGALPAWLLSKRSPRTRPRSM